MPALLAFCAPARAQEPMIFPGGVVNAATGSAGRGLAPGSLATVYGLNLATETLLPDPLLLPVRAGGASVLVGGIPAPLIYISPGQINFQVPGAVSGATTLVVSTIGGTSRPYPIEAVEAFGVFTLEPGGCGPVAALNATTDGNLTLNTPLNSASPGDTLAIFGTGLFPVDPARPDGVPASSNPLSTYQGAAGSTRFDLDGPVSPHMWVGVAAALVGTDQINLRIPDDVREGCAVPMLVSVGNSGNSKPVTLSIRRGGGPCSDPPAGSSGRIQWVKTVTADAISEIVTETVTVSLQSSPGRRKPAEKEYVQGRTASDQYQYFGLECPVPGYRSLTAGRVTLQGPGFKGIEALPASSGPPDSGQVAGLMEYRAMLPAGSIQPGSFRVSAAGGADLSGFEAGLRIGSGIRLAPPQAPGTRWNRQSPITVNWTGGDPDAWVVVKLVAHLGAYDRYSSIEVRASDGTATLSPSVFAGLPAGQVELVVEVVPAAPAPWSVPGLTLGGEQSWKYVYRFRGLTLE